MRVPFRTFITGLLVVMGMCTHAQSQKAFSLQLSLQTAKKNNPQLKAAQLDIPIAETDVVTAGLRPNLSLNNQTLQLMDNSHFKPGTQWPNAANRQVWWQLTKTFQIAGQRSNKIDFAEKNLTGAQYGYTEMERATFAEVANKWLEVWASQKNLSVIESAKNNLDSLVIINQVRFKNQVVTQTDLYRTELLSKQYALQYKTATQELVNKQKELQLLLGTTDNITVDAKEVLPAVVNESLEELIAASLKNRSDMQAAKNQVEVSNSNIKLQKSLAIPQPQGGLIYNPQNTVPYAGIFVTIDLPFFSRNQGEIKKSYLIKQQSEQQYSALQNQLTTEITTAYQSYKQLQQNIENFNGVLQQSGTILSNVKYAYLRGGTTIIDFLEAQRSWLDTQQQYNEALFHYRESYIRLLYATGLINTLAQ